MYLHICLRHVDHFERISGAIMSFQDVGLLALPIEVFEILIDNLVAFIGTAVAVKLRIICSMFHANHSLVDC